MSVEAVESVDASTVTVPEKPKTTSTSLQIAFGDRLSTTSTNALQESSLSLSSKTITVTKLNPISSQVKLYTVVSNSTEPQLSLVDRTNSS